MIKCSNCGHETNKTKLTLSVDRELVKKAKKAKLNLSQVMENALRGVVAIVVIMVLLVPVSVYAQIFNSNGSINQKNLYESSIDSIRMNQIVDACKAGFSYNNTNLLQACESFFANYHKHMAALFTETKDDVIKILVGP